MGLTAFPELNKMINQIQKKFEIEDNIGEFELRGAISTGIPRLDAALRINGVPRARVVELIGQPSSGKTSLALQTLSCAQKQRAAELEEGQEDEKRDLLIDLEHTITRKFVEGFDVDYDKCIHIRASSAEEALQYARDLPKTGRIGVVVFDSVGAAQTQSTQKKDMGEKDVASIAKLMHDALRSIVKTGEETDTTYIFINHITYKIGGYGNPETSPGGQALPFYSSVRLKLLTGKPFPNDPSGFTMRIKVVKNKCGAPYNGDNIESPFYYGRGTDQLLEGLEVARELGLLRHSGGRSKWRMSLDDEFDFVNPEMDRGRDACIEYFRAHPVAYEQLKAAVDGLYT